MCCFNKPDKPDISKLVPDKIEENGDSSDHSAGHNITFIDAPLEEWRTEDSLDGLPFFWQPQAASNHRLVLPSHEDPARAIQETIEKSYYLDYFMAIGKDIGLAPTTIDSSWKIAVFLLKNSTSTCDLIKSLQLSLQPSSWSFLCLTL